MTIDALTPPWDNPGWLDNVTAWIRAELSQLGLALAAPIEQPHVRPWSTVLRVPTLIGDVYFKACAKALLHEIAVTRALSQWQPDCTIKVLAAEPEQGWMLMADGGITVREANMLPDSTAADGIHHWEKLLPRYAEFQIDLASHVDELLSLGLPNRLPATLPDQIEALLSSKDMLLIDQPESLTSSEYERVVGMKDHLIGYCHELAASPIPESIHHGDLHDANVFLDGNRHVFFDWGDSSASHPFFSLRAAFVIIEYFQGYKADSPEMARLRDAYLEPWQPFGSRDELLSVFDLSERLSPLTSALAWNRVVSSLDVPLRTDYLDAVPSLLKEFLELEDKANPRNRSRVCQPESTSVG